MRRDRLRLRLSRETVRELTAGEMREVGGGALTGACPPTATPLNGCNSNLPTCLCIPPGSSIVQ